MFMAGVRRRTGLMQAELQRQFAAIAGIEARMTANNQGKRAQPQLLTAH